MIEENLVETGKVRYVFKDLPLTSIHPQAMLAAEASRCAGTQDTSEEAYLAMHTMLFEEQEAWSGHTHRRLRASCCLDMMPIPISRLVRPPYRP